MTSNINNDTEQNAFELTDEELDLMLAEWANEELDVPEGFHESVMMQLRAEEMVQALPKKGIVVSIAEYIANKRVWVSTIAAAALVVCCLPVLQERQNHLADAENSVVQVYELKSRTVDHDSATEETVMMTAFMADAQNKPAAAGAVNDAIERADKSNDLQYTLAESQIELTTQEQLTLAQDNLKEMEAHLALLDDSEETKSQRKLLQSQIDTLKAEIKVMEEALSKEECNETE